MTATSHDRWTVIWLVAGLALAGALGWLAPQQPLIALAVAAAVLLLGVSAVHTTTIPLLVLPLLYLPLRLAAGGTDLSVSDAALTVGTLVAIIFGPRPFSPQMRSVLWLVGIYQVATLFTVVANPYLANAMEWVHSGVLVAGALLVGWTVGRVGQGHVAVRLLLLASLVLATWIIVIGTLRVLEGDFRPLYLPNGFHKNFMGTVLGTSALVAYIHPAWLKLNPRWAMAAFWWLALAIGFTQSRQAIVALGVALVVLVLRTRTDRRRSRAIIFAVVPAIIVVLTLVRDQLASGNEHNSAFTRLEWFSTAIDVWLTQPLVGVGLRWWYTDRFPGGFQPPNAELEVLSTAGLLGLVAFLVMMIGTIVVLWKLPPAYGTLAALVILSRFVQGQLDIFWVAAQTSIPFVIAGICLGVAAREGDAQRTDAALGDTVGPVAAPGVTEGARA